jgi:hypothetical protein
MRLRLDDRFVIRSLDGCVDSRLADFVRPEGIDHFAYLKARAIDYLLALKTSDLELTAPSLIPLRSLQPGQTRELAGLHFEALATKTFHGVVRVTRPTLGTAR